VGLNFWPQSPRFVEPAMAADILRELPPFVVPVGVFVNLPLEQVMQAVCSLNRLRMVQWHGDSHEVNASFQLPLIPAFKVRGPDSLGQIMRYLERCRSINYLPAAILADGHAEGLYGGTGKLAPWDLLAGFNPGVPLILAGGLTHENVAQAIRAVRPYAVDVASGVESSPGHKDADKMRRFIDNVRKC
jgi:phosphoribosylanthranilate isomerase